jgi:anti-sigma regulatory factor (Ser/Thr protein kinase)
VTAARRFVRERLDGVPGEIREAVELMTSELTSNSVRHAHSGFEVALSVEDEVRVEVRDSGAGAPTLLTPSARQANGRGLRIVEAISSAWGWSPRAPARPCGSRSRSRPASSARRSRGGRARARPSDDALYGRARFVRRPLVAHTTILGRCRQR